MKPEGQTRSEPRPRWEQATGAGRLFSLTVASEISYWPLSGPSSLAC